MEFIDIGANLLDQQFTGIYHGKTRHPPDLPAVLERGWSAGVVSVICTAGSLEESRSALELVASDDRLYSTVGVHPTRCGEFEADPVAHTSALLELCINGQLNGKVVAVGECGLDYDRTQFCSKEIQQRHFERHFELTERTGLPMFLHCRNAANDMLEALRRNRHRFTDAVVHSFDGTAEEARAFLELGLYIGINGCSLKTAENLSVAAGIPEDRLLIETDAPWCEVKRTHAGFHHISTEPWPTVRKPDKWKSGSCVKGRAEVCHLRNVFDVVAGIRGEADPARLASMLLDNTRRVFWRAGTEKSVRTLQQDTTSAGVTGTQERTMSKQVESAVVTGTVVAAVATPPIGHTSFSWSNTDESLGRTRLPPGHTAYSWGKAAAAAVRAGVRRL